METLIETAQKYWKNNRIILQLFNWNIGAGSATIFKFGFLAGYRYAKTKGDCPNSDNRKISP